MTFGFVVCAALVSAGPLESQQTPPPTSQAAVADLALRFRIDTYNTYRTQRSVYDQVAESGRAALDLSYQLPPNSPHQQIIADWFVQAHRAVRGGNSQMPAVPSLDPAWLTQTPTLPLAVRTVPTSTSTPAHPAAESTPATASGDPAAAARTSGLANIWQSLTAPSDDAAAQTPVENEEDFEPASDTSVDTDLAPADDSDIAPESSDDAESLTEPTPTDEPSASAEISNPDDLSGATAVDAEELMAEQSNTENEPTQEVAEIQDEEVRELYERAQRIVNGESPDEPAAQEALGQVRAVMSQLDQINAELKHSSGDAEPIDAAQLLESLKSSGKLTFADAQRLLAQIQNLPSATENEDELVESSDEDSLVEGEDTGTTTHRLLLTLLRQRVAGQDFAGTPTQRNLLLKKIDAQNIGGSPTL